MQNGAARSEIPTPGSQVRLNQIKRCLTENESQRTEVTGYINQQNMVEKVETRIGNDVLARGVYLHYQDFGGLKFPTTSIQQQNGENALILIVDNVKANAPVMGN